MLMHRADRRLGCGTGGYRYLLLARLVDLLDWRVVRSLVMGRHWFLMEAFHSSCREILVALQEWKQLAIYKIATIHSH